MVNLLPAIKNLALQAAGQLNTHRMEFAKTAQAISPTVTNVTRHNARDVVWLNLSPVTVNHVLPLALIQNILAMENVLLAQIISLIATNVIQMDVKDVEITNF